MTWRPTGDGGPLHVGAGYSKNGNVHQFAVRGLYELGAFTFGGYVQRDENASPPARAPTSACRACT